MTDHQLYEVELLAPASEFSREFVQGMAHRMTVSYHKYGLVSPASKIDMIESLEKRLALYKETGNTEWLMDVANFAMIEFMHPRHPDAHFEGTDSDASPGRVLRGTGVETAEPNRFKSRVAEFR